MAPKASTSNVSNIAPSAILADAVTAFTKAATLAFAAVEEQAKLDVARAHAELAALQKERDKNVKALNKSHLQEKDWERHGEMLQTSLEKSELTLNHQAETIAQLREEVTQWKSQLSRLEETSRREIQDWKEQYLRAEQERSRLSARVDELVAEQLQTLPRAATLRPSELMDFPTPKLPSTTTRKFRPSMPYDFDDAEVRTPSLQPRSPAKPGSGPDRERTYVDSQSSKEARIPKHRPVVELSPTRSPKKSNSTQAKVPQASKVSVSRAETQASQQPRQQVIRRVKAVFQVPVKEEEYSDEEGLASDGSEWEPEKKASQPRRPSSAKRKPYVEINDEEDGDEEDDIDQLLIGAEDNPNEIYGTQRVFVAGEIKSSQRTPVKNPPRSKAGTSKKRKLDGDSSAIGHTSTSKLARKKQ